ncbi:MAG: metallophosphoesterase [Clostridia bacterium]|nr:metallophosphoesterase [Clostridia bacterium]
MNTLQIIKTELNLGLGGSAPLRLLHVTDSHICRADNVDAAQNPEIVEHALSRGNAFGGEEQTESYYMQALAYAKHEQIPLVHTGDLYDFLSHGNFAYMDETLRDTDYIYAAGNHDFCHFVGRAIEDYPYKWENLKKVQPHVKQNLYFDSRIIGGLNIVTLDDGYYLFSKGQEEMLRAEAAKGYPILLCMHVPLYTPRLAETVLAHNPCAYVTGAPRDIYTKYPNDRRLQQNPDRATLEMIDYILSEPQIRCVLAGHVHLNFEEPLANGVMQICTHAGYAGYARELILY